MISPFQSRLAQPKLRNTQIIEAKGFLGPFNPLLRVGDVQEMVWPAEAPTLQLEEKV